jgi:hypothetical protein
MKNLHTYEYPVQFTANASGDGSLFTDKMFQDGYLYSVKATGAGFTGTGTLIVKTEAKTGKPATTWLTDTITAAAGIDISLYNLVQSSTGADISGEYNQRYVRRGERIQVVGDDFVDGTLYANLTFANYPLPATR